MMTLHDLNTSPARESIRTAQVISFMNPHTGGSHIVVGRALVEAGDPKTQVSSVTLSVESEGHELELATAAVLAIRGAVDDVDAGPGLRPLTETIRKYWDRGLDVPWTEMLTY